MNEFRLTRPDQYPPTSIGATNPGARHGHYYEAGTVEVAIRNFFADYPTDERVDAQEYDEANGALLEPVRFVRGERGAGLRVERGARSMSSHATWDEQFEAAEGALTKPTVHLNGTSRAELARQLSEARKAIRAAQDALNEASPNGRDYYPQPLGALRAATGEHLARARALASIDAELAALQAHVEDHP
jgi:hypothetical protein